MGDALGVNFVRVDAEAEAQVVQDGDLADGVDALDVGGGIFLGIAVVLCNLQGVLEGEVLEDHLGEDEVRGSVQDAVDFFNIVAGEVECDGTQNRNSAADACLEHVVDVVLLGDGNELGAFLGDQLFVGGDDVFAGSQCRSGEVVSRMNAAHDFGDDFNGLILQDGVEVVDDFVVIGVVRKILEVEDVFDVEILFRISAQNDIVLRVDDFNHA